MYGNENTEIQAFWNVRTFGCFYACTSRLWINLPSGRCLCFRTQRASQLRLAAVQCTVMRFLDLKETSTDMAADWIFEKFKLI